MVIAFFITLLIKLWQKCDLVITFTFLTLTCCSIFFQAWDVEKISWVYSKILTAASIRTGRSDVGLIALNYFRASQNYQLNLFFLLSSLILYLVFRGSSTEINMQLFQTFNKSFNYKRNKKVFPRSLVMSSIASFLSLCNEFLVRQEALDLSASPKCLDMETCKPCHWNAWLFNIQTPRYSKIKLPVVQQIQNVISFKFQGSKEITELDISSWTSLKR